jgi:two-component system, chemotaxis family, sensor kinase CheA
LIRDLAKEKGKEVDFSITGGDIELDRSILEELTETLVHIFRNSIDHGIEPPDDRERSDKPRSGTVTLNAYRERDLVFIEATDDGKGMDPVKIKEAAIVRGIIKEEQANLLSEEDILLLTCMPNLSTQKEVSDISGRGVGMDVVKTKIESLGGSIKIESEIGKGTKIVLILPLTVAIIQALLITAAGATFALPLSKSVRSAEVKKEDIQKSQNQRVVLLNDEMIPLYRLSDILNIDASVDGKDVISVIVIEVRGRNIGLEVEDIKGNEEIFIKSLGNPLERIPGFSGVTVLGDGKPVLILDVVNLF